MPKISDDGVLDIPRSAWGEIEQLMNEEFGATILVEEHDEPTESRGCFVSYAHYWFEVTLDTDAIGKFMDRVHPLIEALIARYRQPWVLPARM